MPKKLLANELGVGWRYSLRHAFNSGPGHFHCCAAFISANEVTDRLKPLAVQRPPTHLHLLSDVGGAGWSGA